MQRKVAIYARVSTEHEAQLSALENQVQYYNNILSQHPEWKLVAKYIDEGITGTSVKKRKNFMRMMDDGINHEFDLIITREVSRFARNTVDTLQQTRLLKKHGVEVYFSEDNIWTMNDEDGELKLTLMATLAQNESKKTSTRVKSGQAISFENGIVYGNGNILGYNKVGRDFVVNEEQAKTVRLIFDLYLQGLGLRKIQYELERQERLRSTGKKNWSVSVVSRIINNPFYCGTIIYRKNVVLDYLEQRKIRNYDYVDKVVVEGNHQAIVTKGEYQKVQELINSKVSTINAKERRGVKPKLDVWCRKLKCSCGSSFNRKTWHITNEGYTQYAYQCYNQIKTGTLATRVKKGLSLEDVCEAPMIPGWKLELIAHYLFDKFWKDKEEILRIANGMLENHIHDDENDGNEEIIESIEADIYRSQNKVNNLIEMRMGGEITKDVFQKKKEELEKKIEHYQKQLESFVVEKVVSQEDLDEKLKVLRYGLEQEFDFANTQIPEPIIDAFVKKIVVYKDHFEWHLRFGDEIFCGTVEGNKRNNSVSVIETPHFAQHSTGSTQQQEGLRLKQLKSL